MTTQPVLEVLLSTGERATFYEGRCTSVHEISWAKLTAEDYVKIRAAVVQSREGMK
jgi:hypothetical protein